MRINQFVVAAAMLLFGAVPATANTITPNFVSAVDQGDGTWLWTYDAYLFNGRLEAGDAFFTLYDTRGYVAGSATATPVVGTWTASVAPIGQTPSGLSPTDAASQPNVTFEYTGGQFVANFTPQLLGTFTFLSTVGASNPDGIWASQDLPTNVLNNTPQPAQGFTVVPAPDGGWTVTLLGSALCGFGLLRRRLRLR